MFAPLPTPAEMAAWDKASIDEIGIRGEMLMENASREAMGVLIQETGMPAGKSIILFAGPGNNGGDAICLGRHLHDQGAQVQVILTRPKKHYKREAGRHLALAEKVGVPLVNASRVEPNSIPPQQIVVDGLLGTGFSGDLRPDMAVWTETVSRLGQGGAFIFSLDIPSGLCGHTGRASEHCVRAHATVCFEAVKLGCALPSSNPWTGRLHVRNIGIPALIKQAYPVRRFMVSDTVFNVMPPQDPLLHKGRAGHVLVIGGSPGLSGAPALAALGALRAGAGLVTVACPSGLSREVKSGFPEIMTLPLGRGESLSVTCLGGLGDLSRFSSIVVGPGMGREPGGMDFMRGLLPMIKHMPVVMDADALYHLAEEKVLLGSLPATSIYTPHPGEMARLMGCSVEEIQADRFGAADTLARKTGAVAVLKGAGTVVADPEQNAYLSPFAVSNLAVGGSGDVLAGVIAALAARNMPPAAAAVLGVHWHGLCGLRLDKDYPGRGNLAREIADALPHTLKEVFNARSQGHHDG